MKYVLILHFKRFKWTADAHWFLQCIVGIVRYLMFKCTLGSVLTTELGSWPRLIQTNWMHVYTRCLKTHIAERCARVSKVSNLAILSWQYFHTQLDQKKITFWGDRLKEKRNVNYFLFLILKVQKFSFLVVLLLYN